MPHALPWERISPWTAPTGIEHVHISDYETHKPTQSIIYLVLPIIRGTGDLDEEWTYWKKPEE